MTKCELALSLRLDSARRLTRSTGDARGRRQHHGALDRIFELPPSAAGAIGCNRFSQASQDSPAASIPTSPEESRRRTTRQPCCWCDAPGWGIPACTEFKQLVPLEVRRAARIADASSLTSHIFGLATRCEGRARVRLTHLSNARRAQCGYDASSASQNWVNSASFKSDTAQNDMRSWTQ